MKKEDSIKLLLAIPGKMQQRHALQDLHRDDLFRVALAGNALDIKKLLFEKSCYQFLLMSSTLPDKLATDLIREIKADSQLLKLHPQLQFLIFTSRDAKGLKLGQFSPDFPLILKPNFPRGVLSKMLLNPCPKDFTELSEANSSPKTSAPLETASRITLPPIIIVDDQAINRVLISKQLKKLNLDSAQADCRNSLIKLLGDYKEQQQSPRLILMDQELKNNDTGSAILKDLQKSHQAQLSQTTIIAVTGHEDEATLQGLRKSGFDDVLGKPMRVSTLHEILKSTGLKND